MKCAVDTEIVTGNARSRICIVDDDDAVRDSMKTLLESCGLSVRVFASPHEFLERRGFEGCGCLILDLHMPVMSGLELLEMLRSSNVAVPALMLTGLPDERLATRLQGAGLLALLPKPVSDSELLAHISTAFRLSPPH